MGPKKTNKLKEIFLRDKPAEMLVLLKKGNNPKYATQLSKGVDCTYSHTIKVLESFRRLGLVEFDKKGRVKLINLTSDGQEVAHNLEGLIQKFSRIDKGENKKNKEKGK